MAHWCRMDGTKVPAAGRTFALRLIFPPWVRGLLPFPKGRVTVRPNPHPSGYLSRAIRARVALADFVQNEPQDHAERDQQHDTADDQWPRAKGERRNNCPVPPCSKN